jgi:hypothetical protein
MSQPTKTEAIKAFLTAFAPADLASLYNYNMELQIIVGKDGGERIQGDFKGRAWLAYTDGIQTWKPIRIPVNANTDPHFEDSAMTYDLTEHAEGIGMTGWDWCNKVSRWVAFDFDAITGHSEKHQKKLTDVELQTIRDRVQNIPWVTLRKSTGGRGLHLYVFLDPITTNNRNEHAAVARAVLSQLSGIAGFDFAGKVDICGGNMWCWHRKMKGTDGLQLLKSASEIARVPHNWRDYTRVVSGNRQKNLPRFIEDQKNVKPDIEDIFDQLTGQRIRVTPDVDHIRVMNWLTESYPNSVWWDAEHHMLVTHTAILKECHEALELRGPYATNAAGTEKGYDINCFMFPIHKGSWAVRRYSLGVKEHDFWEQDGAGWTRCFYNREADLDSAARIYEGLEIPAGGYQFASAEQAQKAALLLGADLALPTHVMGKKTTLKMHKSGRLTVEVDKESDTVPVAGWIASRNKFTKMFNIKSGGPAEPEIMKLDEEIRCLTSSSGTDEGWVLRSDGVWHEQPFQNIKVYLQGKGYKPTDVANIMSSSISQCWTLVNYPFREEYPRNRQWNRNAAQLRFKPKVDRENLHFPTWLKILDHCGRGLDEAIQANGWAKANGIITGSDYLKCWAASLFQEPLQPLPYLFFYGEQNAGKSIFHEALNLLMTRGYQRADTALTSSGNFNGELENAVLCVVEETDLRKNVQAYNRIKDWVTSIQIPIHKKGLTPYSSPNTTHWVQCSNTHLACPVFAGDTRITMINVGEIELENLIPKKMIIPLLEAEAADFLTDILNIELPISNDRLNIPAIVTEDKKAAEAANVSILEMFLAEKCHHSPGYMISVSEFHDAFMQWIDPTIAQQWGKIRTGREMPPKFPKGRMPKTSQFHFGNISWEVIPPEKFKPRLVHKEGFLVHVEEHHVEKRP